MGPMLRLCSLFQIDLREKRANQLKLEVPLFRQESTVNGAYVATLAGQGGGGYVMCVWLA